VCIYISAIYYIYPLYTYVYTYIQTDIHTYIHTYKRCILHTYI
jgi:hypothetical protein